MPASASTRRRVAAGTHDRPRMPLPKRTSRQHLGVSEPPPATEERLQPQLEELAEHQAARERAVAATAAERHDLASNRALLVDALGSTLASRVQSLALDPPHHLTHALGPVPDSPTGRSMWCNHAARLEEAIDNGLQPGDIRPDRAARHHIVATEGLEATTIELTEPDRSIGGRRSPTKLIDIYRLAEGERSRSTTALTRAGSRRRYSGPYDATVAGSRRRPSGGRRDPRPRGSKSARAGRSSRRRRQRRRDRTSACRQPATAGLRLR